MNSSNFLIFEQYKDILIVCSLWKVTGIPSQRLENHRLTLMKVCRKENLKALKTWNATFCKVEMKRFWWYSYKNHIHMWFDNSLFFFSQLVTVSTIFLLLYFIIWKWRRRIVVDYPEKKLCDSLLLLFSLNTFDMFFCL